MKRSLLFFFLCCFSLVCLSEEPSLKSNHPDNYAVRRGDTLWGIAQKFLNNPWLWPEIWHVNPDIENPHLIYPGDIIKLIYINGKPKLIVDYPRDVKLSPSIRVEPLDEAIPAIPLDAIAAFLSESRVVSEEEYEEAAYVVAGGSGHLILGAGDRLYARGKLDPEVAIYGIYRKGDVYIDPESKEILGYQAMDIGSGKVVANQDDINTLAVTRTTQEVRIADRLLPNKEHKINSTFYPSAPAEDINGLILAVEGGVTQIGNMDIVGINRGLRDNLEVGNILAVYKKGLLVRDRVAGGKVRLPEERAGLVMVFRTFEKMSYAIVLNANRPIAVLDTVKNP